MHGSRIVLSAAVAALLVAPACRKPESPAAAKAGADAPARGPDIALDPQRVVATVAGEPIKAETLEAKVERELKDASREFVEKVYGVRQGALEEMVAEKLLALEAKSRGTTPEAVLKTEVDDKVPTPPEEEVKGFYDRFVKGRYPVGFDEARAQILQEMTQQSKQMRRQVFLDSLKSKYKVTLSLPPPAVPRVEVAATGPAKGPEGAKVTIVEFSDFQCPFCSRAKATVDQVMQAYDGKLRLVFRNYPLPFHDKAEGAAKAGICAAQQNQFWALHDAMFAHQDKLALDDLKATAKSLGLDAAKFEKCLDDTATAQALAKDKADGEAAGVNGTPAFFINGRLISGAQPFEAFQSAIDAELGR
jgi:protein-disulfide isomerase